MGQLLHGGATTTAAIRQAIQHGEESLRGIAQRYEINPKAAAQRKSRTLVQELPTGPKHVTAPVMATAQT